jgi:hypothetical protein
MIEEQCNPQAGAIREEMMTGGEGCVCRHQASPVPTHMVQKETSFALSTISRLCSPSGRIEVDKATRWDSGVPTRGQSHVRAWLSLIRKTSFLSKFASASQQPL